VLDREAAAVLEQVRRAASDADELARATGLGAGELAGILTMLELTGAVCVEEGIVRVSR